MNWFSLIILSNCFFVRFSFVLPLTWQWCVCFEKLSIKCVLLLCICEQIFHFYKEKKRRRKQWKRCDMRACVFLLLCFFLRSKVKDFDVMSERFESSASKIWLTLDIKFWGNGKKTNKKKRHKFCLPYTKHTWKCPCILQFRWDILSIYHMRYVYLYKKHRGYTCMYACMHTRSISS